MATNLLIDKETSIKDIAILVLFTLIAYIPFLGLPPWEGNEPLRVIIAKEMIQTGNWIMPILHGKPYLAKPPLMNWLIAISGSLFGTVNEWTSRLPSVVTIFITSLIVYFSTQRWLGREGRLFTAVMTLVMTGILKKGREAEIECLHIMIITSILLVWINGYLRRWKPALLWGISLFLTGIGFLSKGPQVLMFFYMTVIPYLLYRRKISLFFSKGHLFGMIILIIVLSTYLIAILQWTTLDYYVHRWINEGITRAESKQTISFFIHLIKYPFEGIVSFTPCILFLIPLINKELRKEFKKGLSNELFTFCIILLLANFPLYWLLPNMRFRYFLPAGPFFAIATGIVFEWYLKNITNFPIIEKFRVNLLKSTSLLSIIIPFIVINIVLSEKFSFDFSLIFLIFILIFLSTYGFVKMRHIDLKHSYLYVCFITVVLFLIYTNLEVQYKNNDTNNQKRIAQEINHLLPSDIDTIYEIGYRRLLSVTSYIDRRVLQIDQFSELEKIQMAKKRVCFIFDTEYMKQMQKREKNFFLDRVNWQRIYTQYLKQSRGEIIVGLIN
jgi:hypothetical protein